MWSARAAAEYGLPYTFAHFFSGEGTRQAIEYYQSRFRANEALGEDHLTAPQAMAAVGVICADTDEEAQRLAASVRLLQVRIRQNDRRPVATPEEALRELGPAGPDAGEFPRYFVGTPEKVRGELLGMASALGIGEFVVNTITHSAAARHRSYELLAEAFGLG